MKRICGKERSLALGVLLLDARRGWMESDLELKEWLEFHGRPYLVVATKMDKLNQKERSQSQKAFREHYPEGELDLVLGRDAARE